MIDETPSKEYDITQNDSPTWMHQVDTIEEDIQVRPSDVSDFRPSDAD